MNLKAFGLLCIWYFLPLGIFYGLGYYLISGAHPYSIGLTLIVTFIGGLITGIQLQKRYGIAQNKPKAEVNKP
ncbi:MAG: hypothetical protein ACREBU_00080 [Nitrososphaera sp.]